MLKYQINPSIFASGTTASTINIPITLKFEPIDNSEAIQNNFVNEQVQESINPILDYEKIKFKPFSNVQNNTGPVNQITYTVNFLTGNTILSPTYYSNIDFTDDDIKYERNYFLQSYLYLGFYDSDNTLTQNLVTEIEMYCGLNKGNNGDFLDSTAAQSINYSVGHPKLASAIPVRLIVSNPLKINNGFYEGYNIYDYKSDYYLTPSKYLYMKASFFNAKNGKTINLMTEKKPYTIDELVNKLYTRYKLYKNEFGYYYEIDNTYSSNVFINNNIPNLPNITVNLYQIQSL